MIDTCVKLGTLAGQRAIDILKEEKALTSDEISAVKILADICYSCCFNLRFSSQR